MICAIDIYVYIYAVVSSGENSKIESNSDHWSELLSSKSCSWQELKIENSVMDSKNYDDIDMGLSDHAINDININLVNDDEFETVASDQWFRVVGVDLFNDSIHLVENNSDVTLRVMHMNSICLRRTRSCNAGDKVSVNQNDVYSKSLGNLT